MHNLIPAPVSLVEKEGSFSPKDSSDSKFSHGNFPINYENNEPLGLPPELKPFQKAEAYRLIISERQIRIISSSEKGRFYGKKTLEQLLYGKSPIPCGEITDWPRYEHRGFMIDSARHFIPVQTLKELIDRSARLKLNTFHWHLTDDQGWRIPVEGYPDLTKEKGAPYSLKGYYDREEIGEIVAFAAARHIAIIPEIDMPGHISSAVAAYPYLSCTGEQIIPPVKGGIYKDILCTGKESTMIFVHAVLDEICRLFPDPRIHIGGDEVLMTNWLACPDCRAAAARKNFAAAGELHRDFSRSLVQYLESKGKKAILWNDAFTHDSPDESAICQFWREEKEKNTLKKVISRGHKIIYSPFEAYYFDYPHSFISLEKTYNHEPAEIFKAISGKELSQQEAPFYGLECELWSELITSEERLIKQLYPRLMAFAETAWYGGSKRPYSQYVEQLEEMRPYFRELGIDPGPSESWKPKRCKAIRLNLKHIGEFIDIKDLFRLIKVMKHIKSENRFDSVSL